MEEKNIQSLRQAIAKLRSFDPPRQNWDFIQDAMTADDVIDSLISTLPEYDPDPQVWATIEIDLKPNRGLIKRLNFRNISIAASIALLLGLFFTDFNTDSKTQVSITMTVEQASAKADVNWNEDEEEFTQVLTMLNENELIREYAVFHDLKSELAELNEARTEILQTIKLYGENAHLIKQIKAIEFERTEVIRTLAALLT